MKKNKFIFIIIFLLILSNGFVFAEILDFGRDPFQSQLPEHEIGPIVVPPPVTPPPIVTPLSTKKTDIVISPPVILVDSMEKPKLSLPEFEIQGIIWNSDRPQAIVDNVIYGVGDTLPYAQGNTANDRLYKGNDSDQDIDIPIIKIMEISKEGIEVSFQDENHLIKP